MCCAIAGCVKCILCVLNTAVVMSGLLVAAAGFFTRFSSGEIGIDLIPPATVSCLIVFGGMMIAIGAAGCVASFMSFKIVMKIYSGCLLAMSLLLFGLAIYGLSTGVRTADQTIQSRRKTMIDFRKDYNTSARAKAKIDKMHTRFRCCGVDKPEEWRDIFRYPESCCRRAKVRNHTCALRDIYKRGCAKTITRLFVKFFEVLFGLVMLFAIIFVVAGAFAVYITIVH